MLKIKHKYSYKFDRPDHRDYKYSFKFSLDNGLLQLVDLRNQCSPIENQLTLGSCTANALAGNLEFLELKEKSPFADVSRLFIYYNERLIEHTTKIDSGASLRDGIKTLVKAGYCSEQNWAYDISKFTQRPPLKCYWEARKHRIKEYIALNSQIEMFNCLTEGYPFVMGISVFESFESEDVAKTGIVPMPKNDENNLGGHAVCVVGYDMVKKVFIVRNSWGISWGDKGYFYLPFDYIMKLADDFWTVRR